MTNELSMKRGDSTTFRITIQNNGAVFDVTGYSCKLTVKEQKSDSDANAIIGPITGVIFDAANGLVDFTISTSDSDVEPGSYFYDVEITSGGNTHTVLESIFTVELDVSRTAEDISEELYATEEELRTYLQFDNNDYPTNTDLRFFIKFAMKNITLDLDSSNENVLFIATLLFSKAHVLRGLATRSVRTGYVQVNAEGRTITKAYQELVLEAENTIQEYKEFILKVGRREATSTNYMNDTTVIDSWTRQEIIDLMNGTNDALDHQSGYRYSYFWRGHRS